MDEAKKNLKRVIDNFLSQAIQSLKLLKKNHGELSRDDLERLAEKIWELRHYSVELLEKQPDESTWYNASLIKDIVEQPIQLEEGHGSLTMIQAADSAKKLQQTRPLQNIVVKWSKEYRTSEVLFEDLYEISRDLAA